MQRRIVPTFTRILHTVIILVVCSGLAACDLRSFIYPEEEINSNELTVPVLASMEVEFSVFVPESTPEDAEIYVDILDEVTGLAFNPKRYGLTKAADRFYTGKIVLSQNSIIRYRYILQSDPPITEATPLGTKIRYRLAYIVPGFQVRDLVSQWENQPVETSTGRVQGVVFNTSTHMAAANILVSIAGISTITSIDGSYTLDGVPVGTHNLVAYSLDGSYKPFQQGAMIAASSTTPATLQLTPSNLVNITFIVTPPSQQSSDVMHPIRLIGDLFQLGNTFADLRGGMSTLAVRAPTLTPRSDGSYILSIQLPAGAYFQYKYSLGDGFWNAEHGIDGDFRLREMIVPQEDTTFYETITSWEASGAKPIHFSITVPENTPKTEHITLQLNPFGWMEPIPMWQVSETLWEYTLYSPMNMVGEVFYRICRNEQCDVTADAKTLGQNASWDSFTPSLIEQTIDYEVENWANLSTINDPTSVVTTTISKQRSGYIAGIELARFNHPSWISSYPSALENITDLGANWVFLSPTWSVINNSPPVITQNAGTDLLQPDISTLIQETHSKNLQIAVFPRLSFPSDYQSWWLNATRDQNWWQTWFDRYSLFILHQASLAEKAGANAFILGGTEVIPALPLGKLFDGSDANVPLDAEQQWLNLISEIRSRYSGTIAWAIPYPFLTDHYPSFIEQFDWIYVLYSAPLASTDLQTQAEMSNELLRLLDQDIKVLKDDLGKPLILGVQFSSADGAATNCILSSDDCFFIDWEINSTYAGTECKIDLAEQVDMYNAFFIAINQLSWLDGVISRGYYSPAIVQDCSPSIHGKPAADVIWYWYPRLLGAK